MTQRSGVLKGVVRGKTIDLQDESGLPDGQRVTITVHAVEDGTPLPPGEGLRRAFGGWAEDGEELDEYLEWNRQQRKVGRPEIDP